MHCLLHALKHVSTCVFMGNVRRHHASLGAVLLEMVLTSLLLP